jgi:hypothetical protein
MDLELNYFSKKRDNPISGFFIKTHFKYLKIVSEDVMADFLRILIVLAHPSSDFNFIHFSRALMFYPAYS